jgi:serine/threonine-protein kinase
MMLGMFCAAVSMGFLVVLAWETTTPAAEPILERGLVLAVLGGVIALLSAGRWSLAQLRALEFITFAALTLYLGGQVYRLAVETPLAGGSGAGVWSATLLRFALLMIAYGIFVPNHPARAAVMVIAMALTPLAAVFLARAGQPNFSALLDPAVRAGAFDSVLLLTAGSGVAIFAAFVINKLFSTAYEYRRATFYDLEKQIGGGGMGEIWKATHRGLARPVAVKLIREDRIVGVKVDAARRVLQQFEREAKATASLRSPHTVEVFDAGITADGHFYYAMEYLDGLDLETLVGRFGPVPAERAIHLLLQVCDSLAEAHEHGLTHRDIKPANIYLTKGGPSRDHVKVLDFGLVLAQALTRESDEITGEITSDAQTSGTPGYMAPERALQDEGGPRADIYSLGCVAYWLLTGQRVFDAKTNVAVIVEHVRTAPIAPSLRTELPIPPELDAIVLKCLEKEPAKRFQSARDLAAALESVPLARPWRPQDAEDWWDLHFPQRLSPAVGTSPRAVQRAREI